MHKSYFPHSEHIRSWRFNSFARFANIECQVLMEMSSCESLLEFSYRFHPCEMNILFPFREKKIWKIKRKAIINVELHAWSHRVKNTAALLCITTAHNFKWTHQIQWILRSVEKLNLATRCSRIILCSSAINIVAAFDRGPLCLSLIKRYNLRTVFFCQAYQRGTLT